MAPYALIQHLDLFHKQKISILLVFNGLTSIFIILLSLLIQFQFDEKMNNSYLALVSYYQNAVHQWSIAEYPRHFSEFHFKNIQVDNHVLGHLIAITFWIHFALAFKWLSSVHNFLFLDAHISVLMRILFLKHLCTFTSDYQKLLSSH